MGAIPNLTADRIVTVQQDEAGDELSTVWTDRDGAVIPLAALVSVTLTLYDAEQPVDSTGPTGGIINAWDAVEVIANGAVTGAGVMASITYATVLAALKFRWILAALDNPVRHPTLDSEVHGLLFRIVTSGGGPWFDQYGIRVLNLRRVGA